jgi:PTH1 family peptidyl-tRNA hydrolase
LRKGKLKERRRRGRKKKRERKRKTRKRKVSSIEKPRKIIFGLGNPGNDFKKTRHNVGYMVIDKMAMDEGQTLMPGKGKYLFRELSCGEFILMLVKPLNFMNLTGIPVCEAKDFFDMSLENLLVVLDDVNLPFGTLRLRRGGSDGGHKGLSSIIYHFSSEDFPRLRIGVGKPDKDIPLSEYVLLNFSKEELEHLPPIIENVIDCIKIWCVEGIEKAMNITNIGVV